MSGNGRLEEIREGSNIEFVTVIENGINGMSNLSNSYFISARSENVLTIYNSFRHCLSTSQSTPFDKTRKCHTIGAYFAIHGTVR